MYFCIVTFYSIRKNVSSDFFSIHLTKKNIFLATSYKILCYSNLNQLQRDSMIFGGLIYPFTTTNPIQLPYKVWVILHLLWEHSYVCSVDVHCPWPVQYLVYLLEFLSPIYSCIFSIYYVFFKSNQPFSLNYRF